MPPRPGPLTPPAEATSTRLVEAVARRTARRMTRLARRLGPAARLAMLLAKVEAKLATLDANARRDLLHGPDLRGWLSEAELWTEVAALARRSDTRRLFDRVSRSEHLTTLLPAGRIDPGFEARAKALARDRLLSARADLAAILCGLHLAFPMEPERAAFAATLEARPDPERGQPAHRIDLGCVAGPAGPLGIVAGRGARVRVRWDGAALVLASRGRRAVVPRAALWVRDALDALSLVRRPRIPGTPILLAPEVVSSPQALVVGREVKDLGSRLAAAMRLVALAWPQAHREIVRRTAMVVPIRERGLVSFSLAARPGVSFINVEGKKVLALADDLLHETAHHLLHDAQEIERDLVRGPRTEEVQAFDSPWRRARRPLHGILHGAFTFHFRAELFTRLLRERVARPRLMEPLIGAADVRFLRRERRRELSMIARSLRDLGEARSAGLLTPAGRRLVSGLRAWHRRLVAGSPGGLR